MAADEWEWETKPFTPADLAYIQEYAAAHHGEISTLCINQVWSEYTFQAVLSDFLIGAVVNAQRWQEWQDGGVNQPPPQDKQ